MTGERGIPDAALEFGGAQAGRAKTRSHTAPTRLRGADRAHAARAHRPPAARRERDEHRRSHATRPAALPGPRAPTRRKPPAPAWQPDRPPEPAAELGTPAAVPSRRLLLSVSPALPFPAFSSLPPVPIPVPSSRPLPRPLPVPLPFTLTAPSCARAQGGAPLGRLQPIRPFSENTTYSSI